MVGLRRVVVGAMVVAVMVGGLATAGVAQAGDLAAWCQARIDVEAAFSSEDEGAIADALEAFASAAPADVATDSATISDLLAEKGEKAFRNKKFLQAVERVDAYTVENCGFPVIDVAAIDYELLDIPDTVAPGTTLFNLTNDAPKEHHEIVIFRVNDGSKITSAEKIFALSQKKAQKLVSFVGAAEAAPGATSVSATVLEPGNYVYACFLPVGGKKKGAPHITKGMFGEFEVPAS